MTARIFVAATFALAALTADAHYLWIELGPAAAAGKEQEVRIYYGEYNEGVREVNGGRLGELAGIAAWVLAPDGTRVSLPVTTEEKFFRAAFTPTSQGRYVVVAVNIVRGVVDWSASGIGVVRPVYYTYRELLVGNNESVSTVPYPAEAALTITALPEHNSFKVAFNGKPLAGAKVLFHAPNEWSKELAANRDGIVTFNPLWKGQYIAECIYPEKTPGTFQGKAYEAIRHRATFSLEVQ